MAFLKNSVYFFILLHFSNVKGQFDDLQGCTMNDEFLPLIVNCFVAKFYKMLESISNITSPTAQSSHSDPSHVYTGGNLENVKSAIQQSNYFYSIGKRQLQGHATEKQEQQMAQNNFKRLLLDITAAAAKDAQNENSLEKLLIQLRGMNRNPDLQRMLHPVFTELDYLRQDLNHLQEILNDDHHARKMADQFDNLSELIRIGQCLGGQEEEAFENGFTWLRCLFTCSDLSLTSSCMIDAFAGIATCSRVAWLSDLLLRLFVDYMELGECFFEILSPSPDSTLNLVEGEGVEFLQFRTFLPPGVHCFHPDALNNPRETGVRVIGYIFNTSAPCMVEIDMTSSNYVYDILPYVRINLDDSLFNLSIGRPRCRNGSAINQIAIGWHENAINSSGVIVMNADNWNSTFRIPLAATVDHKVEDDQFSDVNFTLKLIVDGIIHHTTKIPTKVYDQDVDPSICQSINDPHIVTFDGRYYNNLYQGYFHLYKHTTLPYEVQLIFQTCGTSTPYGESCNCGVAVRSGDDVLVIDRCRLKPTSCGDIDCRILNVTLFQNGDLTRGTRIFQLDGGLSYEVVLPHGTLVKIKSNGEEFLNVWIIPSTYDKNSTIGLCGTFNENRLDDFTLPNGTILTINDSRSEQPREFIKAWRVVAADRIFDGVMPSDEPFLPTNYCRCSFTVLFGIQCQCGYEQLVETCDLNLGNEFTLDNITSIAKKSSKTSNSSTNDDSRDINYSLEPNNPDMNAVTVQIRNYCHSFLGCSEEVLLRTCRFGLPDLILCLPATIEFHPSILSAYEGCLDDHRIIGNNHTIEWRMAASDAAKVGCLNRLQKSLKVGEILMSKVENDSCINECFYRGVCEYGRCHCNENFSGADCAQVEESENSILPILLTPKVNLCDKRFENCAFAAVFGKNFTDDASITCTCTHIEVLDTDSVSDSLRPTEVDIVFINLNQVSCRLPFSGSFKITVKHNGNIISPPSAKDQYDNELTFIAYDSICYSCDRDRKTCDRKQDKSYCFVNGICYKNCEKHSSDYCKFCNVTYSDSVLYDSLEPECIQKRSDEKEAKDAEKRNRDIRIAVAVSLSGFIVIISIITFLITYRKQQQIDIINHEENETKEKNNQKSEADVEQFKGTEDVSNQDATASKSIFDNTNNNFISPYANDQTLEEDDETVYTTRASSFTKSPPSTTLRNPDIWRVKGEGERTRSNSIDSEKHQQSMRRNSDASSIKSVGIGGGGPITYGRMLVSSDQMHEHIGIGGHGMQATSIAVRPSSVVSERL